MAKDLDAHSLVGPSLKNFGITNPLENPILEVVDFTRTVIASTENSDLKSINVTTANVGTFFPVNQGSNEAALLIDLTFGTYTILVSGENNSTGVALV